MDDAVSIYKRRRKERLKARGIDPEFRPNIENGNEITAYRRVKREVEEKKEF